MEAGEGDLEGNALKVAEGFKLMSAKIEGVTEELHTEYKAFKDETLADYTRAENLNRALTNAGQICSDYSSTVTHTLSQLVALRKALNLVTDCLEQKITTEGARTWLMGSEQPEPDYAKIAEQKAIMAQAAQARSTAAKAKAESVIALERSAAMERDAAQAYSESANAVEEAEAAKKRAEDALRAAELKAKAEREAKRKEEEQRRKREIEERKVREEEEKRRREDAKRLLSPEEEEARRREAERVNPNNWPMAVYSVEPGELDSPVGCVVRSLPGTFSRDKLEVDTLSQLDDVLKLEGNEELVSHILDLIPTDGQHLLKLEEPLAVAIPHCAPRVPTREVVVKKRLASGQWEEIECTDVTIDDMKEFRFVQVRLMEFAPLVAVTRFKKETQTVSRRGGKFSPSVEPRIVLSARPATFRMATDITFEIQPVELMAVSDIKQRNVALCEGLLSSSPVVNVLIPVRRFAKPVTIGLPIPPPPNRAKRPQTAVNTQTKPASDKDRTGKANNRPASAIFGPMKVEEEIEDKLHLLVSDQSSESWVRRPDITFNQSKNKDVATFETLENMKRFLVLRTKVDVTDFQVEKIAEALFKSLSQRPVHMFLRQLSDDPTEVTLHIVNVNSSDRIQKKLAEDGYGIGQTPNHEVLLTEGQKMNIQFWGNIKEVYDARLRCVYNSHIKTKLDFSVVEIDKFAQKAISCYRGMVHVYTTKKKAPVVSKEGAKPQVSAPQGELMEAAIVEEEQVLLDEMLVSLPKPEQELPKPLDKTPVAIKGEGLINDKLLRHLSSEIGDEWRRLARYLKIRSVRIQAILRNNVNSEQENAVYDMLMTWAKKLPYSCNKVDILCQALSHVGRIDLVEDLRDREQDYKEERAQYLRDAIMKKAFVKVAQNAHVTNDWKFLGRQLGLPAQELNAVERDYAGLRERCLQSLIRWREILGPDATMDVLLKHLRQCRYHHVIAQVKSSVL